MIRMFSQENYNVLGTEGFIKVIPNVLTEEQCNQIINTFKEVEFNNAALTMYNVFYSFGDVKGIPISSEDVISKDRSNREVLDNNIKNKITKLINLYKAEFNPCSIISDIGYLLLKFDEGAGLNEHIESTDVNHSEITCSIPLSKKTKGGHWVFFNGEKKVKVPQGSAILYPSNFMYPVELSKVKKGPKFILTTWLK